MDVIMSEFETCVIVHTGNMTKLDFNKTEIGSIIHTYICLINEKITNEIKECDFFIYIFLLNYELKTVMFHITLTDDEKKECLTNYIFKRDIYEGMA